MHEYDDRAYCAKSLWACLLQEVYNRSIKLPIVWEKVHFKHLSQTDCWSGDKVHLQKRCYQHIQEWFLLEEQSVTVMIVVLKVLNKYNYYYHYYSVVWGRKFEVLTHCWVHLQLKLLVYLLLVVSSIEVESSKVDDHDYNDCDENLIALDCLSTLSMTLYCWSAIKLGDLVEYCISLANLRDVLKTGTHCSEYVIPIEVSSEGNIVDCHTWVYKDSLVSSPLSILS